MAQEKKTVGFIKQVTRRDDGVPFAISVQIYKKDLENARTVETTDGEEVYLLSAYLPSEKYAEEVDKAKGLSEDEYRLKNWDKFTKKQEEDDI